MNYELALSILGAFGAWTVSVIIFVLWLTKQFQLLGEKIDQKFNELDRRVLALEFAVVRRVGMLEPPP